MTFVTYGDTYFGILDGWHENNADQLSCSLRTNVIITYLCEKKNGLAQKIV